MASFLELFAPNWIEGRKRQAREKFAAGMNQPNMFQTENMPIPEMVKAYEYGYGMPYPEKQSEMAIPQSIDTPQHLQATANNMPIEYVQPRTAEDMALRGAGIQGKAGMEKTLSGLDYAGGQMGRVQGFFEDAGEDIGKYDIPGSIGRFERPADNDPMVQVQGVGRLPASVAWRYMKDDKADIMVDPDGPGGLPEMPSQHAYHYMKQYPDGKDKYSPIFDDAMETIKSYFAAVKIPDNIKMMAAFDTSGSFLKDPAVIAAVTQQLPQQYKRAFKHAVGQVLRIMEIRSQKMSMQQVDPLEIGTE